MTAAPSESPAANHDRVYKVGGDVKAPVFISKVRPNYTDAARDAKIEGKVSLSLIIDRFGVPQEVAVTNGIDAGLDENAVAAVKQWRFYPATRNGEPVAVEVNFRLN
ncbi:MAG: energy transducer TonB [Acidobacteriaceae bacterium]|nr:energy transducer TonB [Acidobacteriaceae bacterium]